MNLLDMRKKISSLSSWEKKNDLRILHVESNIITTHERRNLSKSISFLINGPILSSLFMVSLAVLSQSINWSEQNIFIY